MTDIERAIKHFENVRDGAMVVLDSFGYKPNENPTLYKRRKLNAELAISALEKQMPKKPTIDKDGCLVCGNCGSYEGIRTETNFIDGFCWECGQALDWSDTE